MPTETPPEENFAANTALPQPPRTNQNVPMNSAANRCSIVGSRMRDSFVPVMPWLSLTPFTQVRRRRVRIVRCPKRSAYRSGRDVIVPATVCCRRYALAPLVPVEPLLLPTPPVPVPPVPPVPPPSVPPPPLPPSPPFA